MWSSLNPFFLLLQLSKSVDHWTRHFFLPVLSKWKQLFAQYFLSATHESLQCSSWWSLFVCFPSSTTEHDQKLSRKQNKPEKKKKIFDVHEKTRLEIEMKNFLPSQNLNSTHLISVEVSNPWGSTAYSTVILLNEFHFPNLASHTMWNSTQDSHEPNVKENYH